MKFASVLAALTIANANGQKRHHAIRRVQEDQSMSMMLDPNKGTKDTGRSTILVRLVLVMMKDVTLVISLEIGHPLDLFVNSVTSQKLLFPFKVQTL